MASETRVGAIDEFCVYVSRSDEYDDIQKIIARGLVPLGAGTTTLILKDGSLVARDEVTKAETLVLAEYPTRWMRLKSRVRGLFK